MRHVAYQSHGVPAAIVAMIDEAMAVDRISPATVREHNHEAGVRYLNITPALVLILVVVMAARYVGVGWENLSWWCCLEFQRRCLLE